MFKKCRGFIVGFCTILASWPPLRLSPCKKPREGPVELRHPKLLTSEWNLRKLQVNLNTASKIWQLQALHFLYLCYHPCLEDGYLDHEKWDMSCLKHRMKTYLMPVWFSFFRYYKIQNHRFIKGEKWMIFFFLLQILSICQHERKQNTYLKIRQNHKVD